jgi:hypothetical protein
LTASQIRGDGVNAYFTQQAGVFEDLNFDLFANLVRESFPVDDDLTRTLILQSLGNILGMNQLFTALRIAKNETQLVTAFSELVSAIANAVGRAGNVDFSEMTACYATNIVAMGLTGQRTTVVDRNAGCYAKNDGTFFNIAGHPFVALEFKNLVNLPVSEHLEWLKLRAAHFQALHHINARHTIVACIILCQHGLKVLFRNWTHYDAATDTSQYECSQFPGGDRFIKINTLEGKRALVMILAHIIITLITKKNESFWN